MRQEQDITQFIPLYKAIAALKKDLKPLIKDNKVSFGNTNYTYVEINSILEVLDPLLEKHGLLLLQPIMSDGNYDIVRSTLFHIETGTQIASSKKLEAGITKAQEVGSMITYYRRYTLQSLLGMRAEDDDGLTASGKSKKAIKPKTKPKAVVNDDF